MLSKIRYHKTNQKNELCDIPMDDKKKKRKKMMKKYDLDGKRKEIK